MEESNDGSFEFSTLVGLNGDWWEWFPNDGFADVGGDEEGNTRAESVSLVEEFVKKKDNNTSDGELDDDEDSVSSAEVAEVTVHATPNISNGFTEGNDESQNYIGNSSLRYNWGGDITFLGSFVQNSVFLDILVDIDEFGTSEKLHDHTSSDNWANTKFHQGSSVGGENDSHPVKRVVSGGGGNTVERDLAAD